MVQNFILKSSTNYSLFKIPNSDLINWTPIFILDEPF